MIETPNVIAPQRELPFRAAVWSLIATVVLSCGLDLFFFSGFYASDDIGYLQGAWKLLTGGKYSKSPDLSAIRLTMVGWNALIAWLLGYHVQLIAGSYIFYHQLLNVLTFLLARRTHDNAVAVLAAFCMATTPLAVTFSTGILPDLPLACFMLLSLLLFQWPYARDAVRGGGASCAALFGAGICVGLAYMAKEAALILLPYFLILWLCNERRRPKSRALLRGVAFTAGVFAVFSLEWAVLSHLTGHSYHRLEWTVAENEFDSGLRQYPDGYYPAERLLRLRARIAPWFSVTGLHYVLAAGALIYPLTKGRRWAPWALALWFFAYHTWGSTRLSEYLPTSLQPRYFTPILPYLFIMYAFLILKVWNAVPRAIASPRAARAVQGVFALALFLYPLPALRYSDKVAGKIYRADIVNSSYQAVRAARAAGDRPVVPSKTIDYKMTEFYKDKNCSGVIGPGACADKNTREALLSTGFYYVELYPNRLLRSVIQTGGMDSFLQPAIQAVPDEPIAEPLPQTRELGPLEIDGHPGVLRRLRRFDLPRRRSEALLMLIFPWFNCRPDADARSAYLYEWTPVK
jgi:hypothetical protein